MFNISFAAQTNINQAGACIKSKEQTPDELRPLQAVADGSSNWKCFPINHHFFAQFSSSFHPPLPTFAISPHNSPFPGFAPPAQRSASDNSFQSKIGKHKSPPDPRCRSLEMWFEETQKRVPTWANILENCLPVRWLNTSTARSHPRVGLKYERLHTFRCRSGSSMCQYLF